LFYIHPESRENVENNRRAHCQQRDIHKMPTNCGGRNAHLFTKVGANAKHVPLNKVFEVLHTTKLANFQQFQNRKGKKENSFIGKFAIPEHHAQMPHKNEPSSQKNT
jgi:hypothetical protein